jgi:hypothetical protein
MTIRKREGGVLQRAGSKRGEREKREREKGREGKRGQVRRGSKVVKKAQV